MQAILSARKKFVVNGGKNPVAHLAKGFSMKRVMNHSKLSIVLLAVCFSITTAFAAEIPEPTVEPKVINPGPPPSDAIILFDGKNLSKWKGKDGGEAKWKIEDG